MPFKSKKQLAWMKINKPELYKKWVKKYGKKIKKKRAYSRKVDTKMKDYGECDFTNKVIRVNPRKRDLLNTIIHEELHRTFPDKGERWVKKESIKREKNLTIAKAAKLLNKYKRKKNG